MILALGTALIVAVALLFDLVGPPLLRVLRQFQNRRRRAPELGLVGDPGRELRAEARARELLRSCVGDEEWTMYRELGFIRMWGAESAYLIYPHRPIVSYIPATGRLLHEYCVTFPDETRPYGSPRLPDSDDVLAKWMALTGDETRLLASANMHMVGRQLDVHQVKRDLWRLSRWERSRIEHEPIGA